MDLIYPTQVKLCLSISPVNASPTKSMVCPQGPKVSLGKGLPAAHNRWLPSTKEGFTRGISGKNISMGLSERKVPPQKPMV